jgi:hypothetical protein
MIRSAQPSEDWRWCYPDDRIYFPDPSGYEVTRE